MSRADSQSQKFVLSAQNVFWRVQQAHANSFLYDDHLLQILHNSLLTTRTGPLSAAELIMRMLKSAILQ